MAVPSSSMAIVDYISQSGTINLARAPNVVFNYFCTFLSLSPATLFSVASLPNHTKMFELVHLVTSVEDFEPAQSLLSSPSRATNYKPDIPRSPLGTVCSQAHSGSRERGAGAAGGRIVLRERTRKRTRVGKCSYCLFLRL
jgi:hypothetical protein